MDEIRGKKLRRYYFTNKSTLILLFFFITLSLIIFMQQFEFLSIKHMIQSEGGESFVGLATGIYAFMITTALSLYGFFRSRINKLTDPVELKGVEPFIMDEYNKTMVLPRKEQQQQLADFFGRVFNFDGAPQKGKGKSKNKKCAFFVGNSGSGKSVLLSGYEKDNVNIKKVIKFSSSDYVIRVQFEETLTNILEEYKEDKNAAKTPTIIIFDQIEKLLHNRNTQIEKIKEFVKDTKDTNINIVFTCTSDTYAKTVERLEFGTEDYETHFLRITKEEKMAIRAYLHDELHSENEDELMDFIDNLTDDFYSGTITMLEINAARKHFLSEGAQSKVLQADDPMAAILKEYSAKIFSAVEDPNLAMVMLYAISYYKSSDGLCVSDFKNLTFAREESITGMLQILKSQKIIKQVGKSSKDAPHLMSHDYLTKYYEHYCGGKVHEQVLNNIRFYCDHRDKWKKKRENEKKLAKGQAPSLLTNYYERAVEHKLIKNIIFGCVIFLCIVTAASFVFWETVGYDNRYFLTMLEYEWNHTIHAITVLIVAGAVFYIYHYLEYFAKIFFTREKNMGFAFILCIILILWGSASVVMNFMMNGLWVVWLSVEWIFMGILHLSLAKKIKSQLNAKDRLTKEGVLYFIIAVVFTGLNMTVLFTDMIPHPWMALFIVFCFLTCRQHLNVDFMMTKVGNFVNLSLEESKND